jgi:Ca-activated chloride channel family protein
MPDLSNFHFLRPIWFWALIPAILLWILMIKEEGKTRRWQKAIAPNLLKHLIHRPVQRPWIRPAYFALPFILIAILTLAGPSWKRQKTPFVQDTSPMVIALDLSSSMNAVDVQPSRLAVARQKTRDLMALRPGGRTGVIAYAGSAHMVLPLTDDAKVIEMYLVCLETTLMPVPGKHPQKALELAGEMLAQETIPGTILFVTDGIAIQYASVFARYQKTAPHQVLVLAVGTSQGGPIRKGGDAFMNDAQGRRVISRLDRKGLEALESQAGVYAVGATLDDRDVRKLVHRADINLKAAQEVDQRIPWEDEGYYLVYSTVLLSLVWFRKGWTIRWR